MNTKNLVRTAVLLALALIFQIGFRMFAQPLVGPLVNMTLILSVLLVGPISGIFIGILTPVIAFMTSIIPLAPLMPIVAVGNILLVIIFYLFNQKTSINGNQWFGIAVSAVVKFIFLAFAVRMILPAFVVKVPPAIITSFTLPQLYTALIGGAVAILIYPLLKKGIK